MPSNAYKSLRALGNLAQSLDTAGSTAGSSQSAGAGTATSAEKPLTSVHEALSEGRALAMRVEHLASVLAGLPASSDLDEGLPPAPVGTLNVLADDARRTLAYLNYALSTIKKLEELL